MFRPHDARVPRDAGAGLSVADAIGKAQRHWQIGGQRGLRVASLAAEGLASIASVEAVSVPFV